MHKLQAYGVHGLLSSIADFLDGRSQRVMLPRGTFTWKRSGVPQSSVLGPLLFLLYINDVTDLFHDTVSIKLFADDIKIYMEIESNSQTVIFQDYINAVSDWTNKWQLKLSYNKCHHLRVSFVRVMRPLVMAALCIRGAIIFLPCSFFLLSSSSIFFSFLA